LAAALKRITQLLHKSSQFGVSILKFKKRRRRIRRCTDEKNTSLSSSLLSTQIPPTSSSSSSILEANHLKYVIDNHSVEHSRRIAANQEEEGEEEGEGGDGRGYRQG
jgi:hypothetical protein